MSLNNNLEFTSITYSKDVDTISNTYLSTDEYLGPEFSTLDEKLQGYFLELFESLGINEELINFVQVFSYDKDQRLYQKWLSDVNKFV